MTAVGQAVNAAEHRRYRPQACTSCNQEHHKDLVFDRLGRGTPPRICPVIMPGRETTPVAAIELMVGISALRSASRITGAAATSLVALGFDTGATAHEARRQSIETQANTGHTVAQNHAEQRYRIAWIVPGIWPQRGQ